MAARAPQLLGFACLLGRVGSINIVVVFGGTIVIGMMLRSVTFLEKHGTY